MSWHSPFNDVGTDFYDGVDNDVVNSKNGTDYCFKDRDSFYAVVDDKSNRVGENIVWTMLMVLTVVMMNNNYAYAVVDDDSNCVGDNSGLIIVLTVLMVLTVMMVVVVLTAMIIVEDDGNSRWVDDYVCVEKDDGVDDNEYIHDVDVYGYENEYVDNDGVW